MTYCIFDLETTSKLSYGRSINQFDPNNRIVAVAFKPENEPAQAFMNYGFALKEWLKTLKQYDVLIAHNSKFDLLFLWGYTEFRDWIKGGGRLWDTMSAAYLLGGQEAKFTTKTGMRTTFASLDELSEFYGGTLKDSYVKNSFEAGLGAEDIDPETLLEYAKYDVINTELVALGQLEEAKGLSMLPILKVHMDHILALCEMEYNGIVVDRDKLKEYKVQFEDKLKDLEKDLQVLIKRHWSIPTEFNPASNEHISALLFGGKASYIKDVEKVDEQGNVILNKGGLNPGKPKTKKTKVYENNINQFNLPPMILGKSAKDGVYTVDEEILQKLVNSFPGKDVARIASNILEYRATSKLLKTYIAGGTGKSEKGLIVYIHPDSRIHPNLQYCNTITGRSSCDKPNLQNVPRDIRDLFVSRWGDEGEIVAVDYSQIEIAIYAYLIQSDKMIQEIRDGVDFYLKRLAWAEGLTYDEVYRLYKDPKTATEWKDKRTNIKAVVLAKQYGKHWRNIARDTGMPEEKVKRIFDDEEKEYPEAKVFYDGVRETIQRSTETRSGPLYIKDFDNDRTIIEETECNHVGFYQSILGKRYSFKEWACLDKMGNIKRYYKSTESANYMIQGTAGDIFFMMLGKLFRILLDKYDRRAIMILEVHDECVLDVKKEIAEEVKDLIKKVLESVPEEVEKRFKLKFNVPLRAEVNSGANWREAK